MSGVEFVVHVRSVLWKGAHWPDRVYIGRGMPGFKASKWGNPFRIGPAGYTRQQAIAKYEEMVRANPELMASLHELDGKILGCWCAPEACHGEVLARLRAEQRGERW